MYLYLYLYMLQVGSYFMMFSKHSRHKLTVLYSYKRDIQLKRVAGSGKQLSVALVKVNELV